MKEHLLLKGGTAINLTIFNLPRLSVDIDLDFVPNLPREETHLGGISAISTLAVVDDWDERAYIYCEAEHGCVIGFRLSGGVSAA